MAQRWGPISGCWPRLIACGIGLSLLLAVGKPAWAARPEPANWFSGDIHVHRSCGGSPVSLANISNAMVAADLSVVSLLADMGNGEVQNPATDLPQVNGLKSSSSPSNRILQWDAEWHWDATYFQYPHQALGGHVVALGLTNASQYWAEYTYPVFQWAHVRNAVAGFAHMQYLPNSTFPTTLDCCTPLEYPVEVALGSCDFISQDVSGGNSAMYAYYRLLNCGFRPGWAAGSDYPCNANIGALVTFVKVEGSLTYGKYIAGIAAGNTVISRSGRSEFLDLKVNTNAIPGDTINLPAGGGAVQAQVTWTAISNATGTVQIVHNGNVVASQSASVGLGSSNTLTTTVTVTNSGWIAARRMENGEHKVHTAAVFVKVNNAPIRASVADAQFYVYWMDQLLARTAVGGAWASYFVTNRAEAHARYSAARAVFAQIAAEAGALAPPVITSSNLPAGVSNVPYSASLTASGGATPFRWLLLSGQLPPGLTLATNTGVISGTPASNGVFNFTVRLTDSSSPSNVVTHATSISISNSYPAISLLPSTSMPMVVNDNETNAVELGLKFQSFLPGQFRGFRFYKGSLNVGTHVGNLWSSNGTLLASAVFTNETASGWQQQLLAMPLTLQSNTTYVVSYRAPNGRYSVTASYFASAGVTNYPVWAPRTGVLGGNGVYAYGPSSFPTNTYDASHYWVDFVFQADTPNTSPPAAADLGVMLSEDATTNFFLPGSDSQTPVTYSIITGPTNGLLSAFNTNTGAISYNPTQNYFGPDTFRYRVSDGSLFATGVVSLTVLSVNDLPEFLSAPTNRSVAELTPLVVTNGAADFDGPAPALSFALLDAPTGAMIDTNGVITWTPTEEQGPGTNTIITAVNDGVTSVTNSFQVTVMEVNLSPAFDVTPTDQTIAELTQMTVTNAAADADVPVQVLTYSLLNPPSGATISSNGVITWTPSEEQGPGTNLITTVASDGVAGATNSFQVVVTEVNMAPVFPATPTDVTLAELAQLTVTNAASDADVTVQTLAYSLLNPPLGATISSNGVIAWQPTEEQGPDTNIITTVVSDGVASSTNSFTVVVEEANVPPAFAASPEDVILKVGSTLAVTNAATDDDWPINVLVYALLSPPANASISTNGLINWTPELTQAPSTNLFQTVVSDGSASLTNSFMVRVLEPLVPPVVLDIVVEDERAIVTFSSVAGYLYVLEHSSDCAQTGWEADLPEVLATGSSITMTNYHGGAAMRVYRVRASE